MNRCIEARKLQDWLDGELAPAEAERLAAHVAGCRECEAEAAAYRVVWSELRALPLLEPRPELFERIMEHVLPHRLPRWVRVLGWAYAGAFVASLAALRSLTSTGSFVLRTLSDGLARTGVALAGGGSAGRLLRLLGSVLAHPAVLITVLAALAVCGALLWWMHPRERRATGEMPDVGLLVL